MKKSELWKQILEEHMEDFNLDSFRHPGQLNSRLASWNPVEKSLRWYRSFLLLCAKTMSETQIEIYRNFGEVDLGSPISVGIVDKAQRPLNVNLDYLLSTIEVQFLSEYFQGNKPIKTILEIGAGFGRTCHAMLNSFNNIEKYTILDLPEMLEVSKSYLQRVLTTDKFEKVEFYSTDDEGLDFSKYDLSIQIDGLQEMDSKIIDNYYLVFFSKTRYFLSINPIGKYLPISAGLENVNEDTLQIVLNLGRSREIIDIWDLSDNEKVRLSHISNFNPGSAVIGKTHDHPFFPHYQMTMYKNR